MDLLDEELREYLKDVFPGALHVSAQTGEGLEELRDSMQQKIQEMPEPAPEVSEEEHVVFRPSYNGVRVERDEEGRYVLTGREAERLALKTDWENREALEHFHTELERHGMLAALRRAGAEPGDEIVIGEQIFDFH